MNTEQFEWVEPVKKGEDLTGISVYIIDGRVDFSWTENNTTVGVTTDPLDPLDSNWATIQITGRAHV